MFLFIMFLYLIAGIAITAYFKQNKDDVFAGKSLDLINKYPFKSGVVLIVISPIIFMISLIVWLCIELKNGCYK